MTTQDKSLHDDVAARAGELWAAGEEEAAIAILREQHMAAFAAREKAERLAARPGKGDRIAGAIVGAGRGAYVPFMLSLAAGAFAGPHVAAAMGSLTLGLAALGAVYGFATGGAS